jgi:hypothetical protein
MPTGSQIQLPRSTTVSTVSASGIRIAAATSGRNQRSRFAVYENTIPICFSRWPNETFSRGFAMATSLVAAGGGGAVRRPA